MFPNPNVSLDSSICFNFSEELSYKDLNVFDKTLNSNNSVIRLQAKPSPELTGYGDEFVSSGHDQELLVFFFF